MVAPVPATGTNGTVHRGQIAASLNTLVTAFNKLLQLGAHGVILSQGGTNSSPTVAAPGAAGTVLTSNGTTSDPSFQSLPPSPPAPSPASASLGSDVPLNVAGNYFDGPSINVGSTGTWRVDGVVTLSDLTNAPTWDVKLWDGATVIDSRRVSFTAAVIIDVALGGFITSPAGNLRISVKPASVTTGSIKANASGNLKDSTISAFRIA